MSHCCIAIVAIAVAVAVPLLQLFFIVVAPVKRIVVSHGSGGRMDLWKLDGIVMCVEDVAVAQLEVVKSGK